MKKKRKLKYDYFGINPRILKIVFYNQSSHMLSWHVSSGGKNTFSTKKQKLLPGDIQALQGFQYRYNWTFGVSDTTLYTRKRKQIPGELPLVQNQLKNLNEAFKALCCKGCAKEGSAECSVHAPNRSVFVIAVFEIFVQFCPTILKLLFCT